MKLAEDGVFKMANVPHVIKAEAPVLDIWFAFTNAMFDK